MATAAAACLGFRDLAGFLGGLGGGFQIGVGEGLGQVSWIGGIGHGSIVKAQLHLLTPKILHLAGVGIGNQALHLGGVALLRLGIIGFKGVKVRSFGFFQLSGLFVGVLGGQGQEIVVLLRPAFAAAGGGIHLLVLVKGRIHTGSPAEIAPGTIGIRADKAGAQYF